MKTDLAKQALDAITAQAETITSQAATIAEQDAEIASLREKLGLTPATKSTSVATAVAKALNTPARPGGANGGRMAVINKQVSDAITEIGRKDTPLTKAQRLQAKEERREEIKKRLRVAKGLPANPDWRNP